LNAMAHRGPDDEGIWESAGHEVILGHRRLSIIDLCLGHQPMLDVSGDYAIVFNGEIYNHTELREELRKGGARFRTQSDTEVILEAYRRWGVECLQRLDGMFAFALWDGRKKTLLLARDPFGEKPLYHAWHDGKLFFASEPKALFALGVSPRFSPEILPDFFIFRSIPAPLTMFHGVRKLPAGAFAVLGDSAGDLQSRPYWTYPTASSPSRVPSEAEAAEELLARIRSSVRLRLRSDVPVGAFLSGGVDSSLITALMCMEAAPGTTIRTFSVTVGDETLDESPYQQMVARQYGTIHTSVAVGQKEMSGALRRWFHICDDLVADPSAVALYLLSGFVQEAGIKVVLSGEGADEVFAGYHSYARFLRMARQHRRLRFLGWSHPLAAPLLARFGSKGRSAAELLNPRFTFLGTSLSAAYSRLDEILEDPISRRPLAWDIEMPPGDSASLRDLLTYDLRFRLADDVLPRTDRATMAASVEARTPFLSGELVRWALTLPAGFKIRKGISKYILKRVAERHLPSELIYRRKIGFELPVATWLRTEFAPDIKAFLEERRIPGVRYDHFAGLWRQGCPPASLETAWRWFSLESWYRVWFS
jgi:asparagine synthase (glutamine-hydrolysing)